MTVAKVLVVGSVDGYLRKTFDRIAKLHLKQNFNFALIVGDLFADAAEDTEDLEAILGGQIKVPLPTYFSLGNSTLPDKVKTKIDQSDGQVCPNLTFLGRKCTFTTSEGIRLVMLGGRMIQNEGSVTHSVDKFDPLFLEADAQGLKGAHSAHILLTNQWPAGVTKGSNVEVPHNVDGALGVQAISQLCSILKPRYHFSSSPSACWEREAFEHNLAYNSLETKSYTRFRSLASIEAPTKEWMYAFNIDPKTASEIAYATQSPFERLSPLRKRPLLDDSNSQYSRYSHTNGSQYPRNSRKRQRMISKDPSDCFMCANKPGFKTHMVVSIGDESLVTVLRGPLPLANTFPQLSFSGHAMIIPHYHAADETSQGKRSEPELDNEFAEMNKYRRALSHMMGLKSQGKLGTVAWEVNRTGIRHLHWQLMAVQSEHIRNGLVEAAFRVSREKHEYPAFEKCNAEERVGSQKADYFRLWIWAPNVDPVKLADQVSHQDDADIGETVSFWFPLPSDLKFNIWFGREVMASLLELESRINWMDACEPTEEKEQIAEEKDTSGLQADFKDFDFAM